MRHGQRQDGYQNDRATIEALLTGGDPRSLRNASVVIDDASRRPERLDELVQCVFSDNEIVRMRASDALEKVCRSSPDLLKRFVPRLLTEMSRIEQGVEPADRTGDGAGGADRDGRATAVLLKLAGYLRDRGGERR